MALTNKIKKKIDRKFDNIEEELAYTKSEFKEFKESLKIIFVSTLFTLFCFIMLFDQIVGKILFPFIKISYGIGYFQWGIGLAIIGAMWWLKRRMR